ncbi:uncharacterized protein F4807DRAFT_428849 [Annulohypoxylon truncatum]|uniref:uncharacterized protein n=1 Tax=Annulohypoxylon truncatum TaxID=327061 RepID=UPI002007F3D1|nr:uncharacterized protein F4807DRAFT_428849 [Annulohypoxylon truncatum]KAI1209085.1 hypothetical protein F4807DRAFT_428849 [Annulohypoxylon truncatum]
MAETNHYTVPVGTRHSFSIELECLVAYVPTGGRDPDEFTTQGLPPLLLVDFSNEVEETAVLAHILNTFNSHGIPVISQPSEPTQSSADDIDPSNWIVAAASSTNEYFLEGYFWQFLKIRSPVMWSQEAAFERIQFVVNLLTSTYRLRVNPTCNFGVHVGDGTRLFTAATIKRIGAFLWAADPIFSRLHAPWRRYHDTSRSIRLDSALARGTTAEQVSKKWEGEFHEEYDPIPVTEFSNTSREETEYGGKEGWAEFARWRNEAGPFIKLGEDIDEADRNGGISDDNDGNDSSNNDTINGGSNESSSDDDDDDDEWQSESSDENAAAEPRLPSPRGVLEKWQRALEEDRQIPVPPDPNTLHRNIGWVAWDSLQDERVYGWLCQYCHDNYGHTKLYKLPAKEQITLMLRAQCAIFYGHADIRLLDADQEYEILVAASQYIAAGRSSWDWNAETERWNLAWRRVGNILRHPAAHREIKIDAPSIVQNFENLAKLTDFHNEDNELGIEYVSPQDYDEAALTNKGIEKMLHDLKSYAQPPDPNFMANLADPQQEGWSDDGRSTHSSDGSSYVMSKTEEQITERLPKDFDYELWAMLLIEIQDACRVKGLRSEHSSDTSWPVSFPSVETAPLWLSNTSPSTRAQKIADIWTYIEGVETATPRPETPMPKTREPKLRPHNPDDLGTSYKASINKLVPIAEEEWDRAGYPAPSNNPHSDPNITAEQGIAELSSCDAAATAAELLSHPGPPLNYDFAPYTLSSLNSNQNQNQNQQQQHGATVTHRSISFREAAGSLDAKWITTWIRICVGVVGWARRASADEYVRILDRVTAQGQRELRRAGAGPGYPGEERDEAERYDVCMLLEDLGLFAEAAWVWRREQERGPPR